MGANSALKETVPVIDLSECTKQGSDLSLGNTAISKVVDEIRNACVQWGFFYVVGHGVEDKLLQELRNVSVDFFHKPEDFKKAIHRNSTNYRGYVGLKSELTKQQADFKECFDFGVDYNNDLVQQSKVGEELREVRNQWPEVANFKETVTSFFSVVHNLSSTIMDLIFLSLGVDPATMRYHFDEKTSTSAGRINYYPACKEGTVQGMLGVGPHTDPGVLTVLLQDDNVASLQTQKDGQFHDVAPIPGSFVINIGDMMQVWSNGLYKAPVHRVLTNAAERFSVPFFYFPSYESDIAPVSQAISSARPCRYNPINWGEFFSKRISGNYADYGEEIQIHHYEKA